MRASIEILCQSRGDERAAAYDAAQRTRRPPRGTSRRGWPTASPRYRRRRRVIDLLEAGLTTPARDPLSDRRPGQDGTASRRSWRLFSVGCVAAGRRLLRSRVRVPQAPKDAEDRGTRSGRRTVCVGDPPADQCFGRLAGNRSCWRSGRRADGVRSTPSLRGLPDQRPPRRIRRRGGRDGRRSGLRPRRSGTRRGVTGAAGPASAMLAASPRSVEPPAPTGPPDWPRLYADGPGRAAGASRTSTGVSTTPRTTSAAFAAR